MKIYMTKYFVPHMQWKTVMDFIAAKLKVGIWKLHK